MSARKDKKCDKCKISFRSIYHVKGKQYCFKHSRKFFTRMDKYISLPRITMDQVLNKTYLVVPRGSPKYRRTAQGILTFPYILIGKKVRIVLVKEDDDEATNKL